jgi:hypothetical protein
MVYLIKTGFNITFKNPAGRIAFTKAYKTLPDGIGTTAVLPESV